jgi:hypothetical protein
MTSLHFAGSCATYLILMTVSFAESVASVELMSGRTFTRGNSAGHDCYSGI